MGKRPLPGTELELRQDGICAAQPPRSAYRWIKDIPVMQEDRVDNPLRFGLEHVTEADVDRAHL